MFFINYIVILLVIVLSILVTSLNIYYMSQIKSIRVVIEVTNGVAEVLESPEWLEVKIIDNDLLHQDVIN